MKPMLEDLQLMLGAGLQTLFSGLLADSSDDQ